ncbi:MAG: ATP-grasp domain-containing protein [Pseudonocardiales bacterium]
MTADWLVLVESNTSGSGRLFCAAAHRLGLRPVLLARDPARYPYLADDAIDCRVVDTSAVLTVRQACADLGGAVVGVTSSSEYFVGTAAEVAESLGLPHPDAAAVRRCRDKGSQRARLTGAGVPGPQFAVARTPEQARAAATVIGLPVVVKPVSGSGSIGTRLCGQLEDVGNATGAVLDADPADLGLPPQGAVVVEGYLNGDEYSVETLDEHVVGITCKHLGAAPYFVEIGHDFPAPLPVVDDAALRSTALGALRALGLGWGPAHVELRLSGTGPQVVEVNPRLAGGMIPRMVQECTGIDMIEHTVAQAAGQAMAPRPSRRRAGSIRFLVADRPGRLIEVTGLAAARQVPGVVEVGLTRKDGDHLVLRHSFQDRLGYVIACADDAGAAAAAADEGLHALSARVAAVASLREGSSY